MQTRVTTGERSRIVKKPTDDAEAYNLFLLGRHHYSKVTPEDFAKADIPVLTIHGTKDRSAPYGGGRDWAAMLPQGRLLTVHNAAHAPWIEAPTLVFDAIKLFLDGRWPEGAQRPSPSGAR